MEQTIDDDLHVTLLRKCRLTIRDRVLDPVGSDERSVCMLVEVADDPDLLHETVSNLFAIQRELVNVNLERLAV